MHYLFKDSNIDAHLFLNFHLFCLYMFITGFSVNDDIFTGRKVNKTKYPLDLFLKNFSALHEL